MQNVHDSAVGPTDLGLYMAQNVGAELVADVTLMEMDGGSQVGTQGRPRGRGSPGGDAPPHPPRCSRLASTVADLEVPALKRSGTLRGWLVARREVAEEASSSLEVSGHGRAVDGPPT